MSDSRFLVQILLSYYISFTAVNHAVILTRRYSQSGLPVPFPTQAWSRLIDARVTSAKGSKSLQTLALEPRDRFVPKDCDQPISLNMDAFVLVDQAPFFVIVSSLAMSTPSVQVMRRNVGAMDLKTHTGATHLTRVRTTSSSTS
jgi:hypothetical protein